MLFCSPRTSFSRAFNRRLFGIDVYSRLSPRRLAGTSSSVPRPRLLPSQKERISNQALYVGAVLVLTLGASYAAVPLYRLFCTATGYGGTPNTDASKLSVDRLVPLEEHR